MKNFIVLAMALVVCTGCAHDSKKINYEPVIPSVAQEEIDSKCFDPLELVRPEIVGQNSAIVLIWSNSETTRSLGYSFISGGVAGFSSTVQVPEESELSELFSVCGPIIEELQRKSISGEGFETIEELAERATIGNDIIAQLEMDCLALAASTELYSIAIERRKVNQYLEEKIDAEEDPSKNNEEGLDLRTTKVAQVLR